MALIALIATGTDVQSLPDTVKRLCQDHGIDLSDGVASVIPQATARPQEHVAQIPTAPQPQERPQATPPQVANRPQGQASNGDGASAARQAKAFYSDVAHAIGQSRLTADQQATAKSLRKQGADVQYVAAMLAGPQNVGPRVDQPQPQPQPQRPSVVPPVGTPPQAWPQPQGSTPQAYPAAQPQAPQGQELPEWAQGSIDVHGLSCLRMVADSHFQSAAKRQAIVAYCDGQLPWSQLRPMLKASNVRRLVAASQGKID